MLNYEIMLPECIKSSYYINNFYIENAGASFLKGHEIIPAVHKIVVQFKLD